MTNYISADKLIAEIERRKELLENGTGHPEVMKRAEGTIKAYNSILAFIDSLQREQPEGYFFCKFGGMIPKCADCARNHANSPYTVTEIDTWMRPGTLGTKQCSDYIRKEQPEETIDKSLDEAAEEYVQKGHLLPEAFIVIPTFKEGARWQREQMLKGVVKGEVKYHDYPEYKYVLVPYEEFNDGDKVRIIIVKEEEDK